MSGTLIALDISKKHHDAKIRYPDGRTSYLRIENTLEGFNRLLALTASPHDSIIAAFEPTSDYHRMVVTSAGSKVPSCFICQMCSGPRDVV